MDQIAILITFPLLMIGAGIGDCLTYKIPNWLVGLIGLLFFPAAVYAGMPVGEIGWHLAAAAIVLTGCFILFCFGQFGGGDAKLLTVGALWIGMSPLLPFLIFVALSGGVLALVMKFWWLVRLNADVFKLDKLAKRLKASIDLPYGVAIAGGALIAFPDSWIYQAIEGPKIF
jgi:prepilin peptidase CpaA